MKFLEAKLITLGHFGVGKTCIIKRFVDKSFEPGLRNTVGACFFWTKIDVGDIKLTLHIWDTAGQEQFRSILPMYYRAANAILLTFDITKYETFFNLKLIILEFRKYSDEKIAIFLVANKLDLIAKREVSEKEAKEYASLVGASYHEVSALENYGIDELFDKVATELIDLTKSEKETSMKFYEYTRNNERSRNQVLRMLESSANCSETKRKKKCACK